MYHICSVAEHGQCLRVILCDSEAPEHHGADVELGVRTAGLNVNFEFKTHVANMGWSIANIGGSIVRRRQMRGK